MLSLIIPYYNYRIKELSPLLSSIEMQLYVDLEKDIEVIIVDANSPQPLTQEEKDLAKQIFHFPITYYRLDRNGGPGPSRQYGIEHCNGDYVMFADQDDILYDAMVFSSIFCTIDAHPHHNMWIGSWYKQTPHNLAYHPNTEHICIHGGVWSKKWLLEKKVQFHPDVWYDEDNYFWIMVRDAHPEWVGIDRPLYVWKNNVNSITRRNKEQFLKDDKVYFITNSLFAFSNKQDQTREEMIETICRFLIHIYGDYGDVEYHVNEAVAAIYWKAMTALNDGMVKYDFWRYWDECPQFLLVTWFRQRRSSFQGSIPRLGLFEWIKEVRALPVSLG